jgi:acyl-coenzyme A synthetase/AMP-(fatty) acid ligase
MTGLTRRSRLLLTMSFTVNGMYACATACLRAGGTVVSTAFPEASDIARVISEHAINHLILTPVQIGRVLESLPEGFAMPPRLTLCSFGAAISSRLREHALSRLATEVIDMYGSNEAGFMASASSARDDGISAVWPDVNIEIVDERDTPLPHGQVGHIRVKTPDMIQGYVGDPEATRRMFRDGWFYPGDLGILHGTGRLQILGRGDDLLNFGGRKMPAESLEQAITKRVTRGDVAVCSIASAAGIEALFVGVSDAGYDDPELLRRLNDALGPFLLGEFYVVKLPRIPRNANGKIQRDLLKRAVAGARAQLPAQ